MISMSRMNSAGANMIQTLHAQLPNIAMQGTKFPLRLRLHSNFAPDGGR